MMQIHQLFWFFAAKPRHVQVQTTVCTGTLEAKRKIRFRSRQSFWLGKQGKKFSPTHVTIDKNIRLEFSLDDLFNGSCDLFIYHT